MRDPFFEPSHSGFMGMPSFDDGFGSSFTNIEKDIEKMHDQFKVDPSHGDVHSQSFSSSSSSQMGEDGKMHTKESKAGSQKECHDGKCFVRECANGVCKEREVDAKQSDGNALTTTKNNQNEMGMEFGNIENSIENSMRSMNDNFKKVEQDMANTFKSTEANLEQGLEKGNGKVHTESFSSSSSSQMGEDGKIHTKEKKAGNKIECHDGVCKQLQCNDGVCKEMIRDQATGELI